MIPIQSIKYEVENPRGVIDQFKWRVKKKSNFNTYFYYGFIPEDGIIGDVDEDSFVIRPFFKNLIGQNRIAHIIIEGKISDLDQRQIEVNLRPSVSLTATFILMIFYMVLSLLSMDYGQYELISLFVPFLLISLFTVVLVVEVRKSEKVITDLIEYGESTYSRKMNNP